MPCSVLSVPHCTNTAVLLPCLCRLQASQAERIRKDIDAFTARVQQHKAAFASHVLYKYSTGYTAAYPMLDAAAADLAKLSKECAHQTELASVFELTSAVAPVTEAIKELYEQLVAIKDVWDCCMLCDVQFQVRSLCFQHRRSSGASTQVAACHTHILPAGTAALTAPAVGHHQRAPALQLANRCLPTTDACRTGSRPCGMTSTPTRWRRVQKALSRRSRPYQRG